MNRVCIDTDILGWAIKGYTSDGQDQKIVKAKQLIEFLSQEKITVLIPSIVVAELLSDVEDEDEREKICDYLSKYFFVLQFDIVTARVFAEIRIKKAKEKQQLKEHRNKNNVPRCKMKNDWNICAIALSNRCDTIFTNNVDDFQAFAGDLINVKSLDFVDEIMEQRRVEEIRQKEFDAEREKENSGGQVKLFPESLDKPSNIDDSEDVPF